MTLLTATRPAPRTDRHGPRTDGPIPRPVRDASAAGSLRIVSTPSTECRCLLAAVGRCPDQNRTSAPAT